MPDGPAVTERSVIDTPVRPEDMPVAPPEMPSHHEAEPNAFTDEEGAPPPAASGLLDGPERTIDDLRATVAEMKKVVGRPDSPKEDVQDYKPEKPVGKIRQFLKRHPVLAPIMAPLAGLAAIMMLIARSAFKSTKERQGQ